MKKIITVLISFIFLNCSNYYKGLAKIKYHVKTYENPQGFTDFVIKLPNKFKRVEKHFDHSFEICFTYKDSSVIFISNDKWSGAFVNIKNRISSKEMQDKILFRKSLNDSIYLFGKQSDNKFWRENILNDVVIGYYNVSEEKKQSYDAAIKSITRSH
jgi:hypothetical protein